MTELQKKRFADALTRVSGDCELLCTMAMIVAEDAPEVVGELDTRVAAKEMPEVAATAHKLKGMLSTFDTAGPVLELEELIALARKNKVEEATSQYRAIKGQINHLLQEIDALAQTTSPSTNDGG